MADVDAFINRVPDNPDPRIRARATVRWLLEADVSRGVNTYADLRAAYRRLSANVHRLLNRKPTPCGKLCDGPSAMRASQNKMRFGVTCKHGSLVCGVKW